MPHANAWIRALCVGTNMLSCLDWQICMKRCLGIAIFESKNLCSAGGKQVMDVFGHHAVVCDCSGNRIKRHNAIRDCLFDACSAAAWGPVKEMPFLIPGSSEKQLMSSSQISHLEKDWSLTPQSLALCNPNSFIILQSPKDLLAMSMPNQSK